MLQNIQLPTIPTVDNTEFTPPEDFNVVDYLPQGGGMRIYPRIVAGQPRNSEFPEGKDQLYLIETNQGIDETGGKTSYRTFKGPFGTSLIVRPVGYALNRLYMPKLKIGQPLTNNKPLCKSEDYLHPDSVYSGKFSPICAALNVKKGKMEPVCWYGDWNRDEQGKPNGSPGTPPRCSLIYVICVVFPLGDELITAEARFKSLSARAGDTIIHTLRKMEQKHLPIYSYPLVLNFMEAGDQASTYAGRILAPTLKEAGGSGEISDGFPDESDIPALQAAQEDWIANVAARKERAARPVAGQPDDFLPEPEDVSDIPF